MLKKTAVILICLCWFVPCLAQEGSILTQPIDYFGDDEKTAKKKENEEKERLNKLQVEKNEEKKIIEDPWLVPITQPDGTIRYHRPPRVVTDFLDNPNEKTAEAYWEWNRKRIEKYIKGNKVLQDFAAKKGLTTPYYSTSGRVYNLEEIKKYGSIEKYLKETGGLHILYFSQPDCPYCKVQSSELEKFSKANKDIFIKGISAGKVEGTYSFPMQEDKGEVALYNVDFFPTLLFVFPDGKTYRLRSAITAAELGNLLDTVKKARAVQKK